jgi:heme-degrading monooxygenase HmoA
MLELLTQPPPSDAIAEMAAAGVRMAPTMLGTQLGPDGGLGPEPAGALLILQATFVDEERAAGFWRAAASLTGRLATAPGFIRRYTFADGPHFTLLAFWRTAADATAFFESDAHQAAMRDLFRHRWQYSHFAGLWEATAPRQRVIFCPRCDGVTPATAGVCNTCGSELVDPIARASDDHR